MNIPLIGKVGDLFIDYCSQCDDEADLLITEVDLVCQECGYHEPHYTE
jgi:hypothetical protein